MGEIYKNKYRIASARAQWWDYGWNGAYFITICTKNREHSFGEIENGAMKLSNIGIIAELLWYEIKNHANHVELGDYVIMPNHMHGILILDKPGDGIMKIDSFNGSETDGVKDGSIVPNCSIDPNDRIVPNVLNDLNDPKKSNEPNTPNTPNDSNNPKNPNVETRHALSLHSQSPFPSQQSESPFASLHSQSPIAPQPFQSTNPSQQPPPTPQYIGQIRFQNQGKNTISSIVGGYKSAVTKHANRLGFEFGWQPRFHDRISRNDEEYQRISDYIVNNPVNWVEDRFYKS